MRKLGWGVTSALVFLGLAAGKPAAAQEWWGIPLSGEELGFVGHSWFGESVDQYGVGAFKSLGVLTVGAGYAYNSTEGDASAHSFGANVGANLPVAALNAAGAALFPVGGVTYTSWDGVSTIEVPVGAGLSYAVDLGDGMAIQPYVIPQFVWMRTSFDDDEIDLDSTSDSEFGFNVGGNLLVSNLAFGAVYRKVGDGDGVFGINVGVRVR